MAELPMADRPDVVLPPAPAALDSALDAALAAAPEERRKRAAAVVADDPTFLAGWAALAELGRDPVERYAYARVGYHRGLDAIRKHGWGGVGTVRWRHDTNRGFLRCLVRLRDAAAEIGEQEEVERISDFLTTLDPDWDDGLVD